MHFFLIFREVKHSLTCLLLHYYLYIFKAFLHVHRPLSIIVLEFSLFILKSTLLIKNIIHFLFVYHIFKLYS